MSEPVRIVTVRMPAQLHSDLKDLAHTLRKSLNTVCVDALRRQCLEVITLPDVDSEHPDAVE